jgi:hypothetical protein
MDKSLGVGVFTIVSTDPRLTLTHAQAILISNRNVVERFRLEYYVVSIGKKMNVRKLSLQAE